MLLVVLFGGEIGGETEVGRYPPPPLTLLEEEELLIAILDRWLAMGAASCLRPSLSYDEVGFMLCCGCEEVRSCGRKEESKSAILRWHSNIQSVYFWINSLGTS